MSNWQDQYSDDDFDDSKSKTQVKKEMHALQALGIKLTELNATQRASIPMDDQLREAIEETPRITQNSARRRHLQFIGKLMRKADTDAIQSAYDQLHIDDVMRTRLQQQLEQWRTQLLEEDNQDAVAGFLKQNPHCDRQKLNQLIRAAKKDMQAEKPKKDNAKKLFRFLTETINTAPKE